MTKPQLITLQQAKDIAGAIGINWDNAKFDLEQFWMGVNIELEHGSRDVETNVTNDDPVMTGKIAWAHLKEIPDYYTRLKAMESEANS
jgi:Protein of unknown function (DUF5661)